MRFGQSRLRCMGAVGLALVLAACGGGGDSEQADATGSSDPELTAVIDGSVGDGPVVDAELTVSTNTGEVLQNTVSDELAGYNLQVKTKGKYYPLLVEARGGTDLVTHTAPEFTLAGVAMTPGRNEVVNLSPFSSLAVATARQMPGGLSSTSVTEALNTVVSEFDSGLISLSATGPMSTRIDDSNLAEIVRASEVLAETLRRTNAAVLADGGASTVDDVIATLGADLVDGRLDGVGTAAADPFVSAVAAVAASQVLVEAMTNQLQVDGRAATAALDAAVDQLAQGTVESVTSVPITAGMIDDAKLGVMAASAIAPSPELTSLLSGLETLSAGMLPAQAASALPPNPWAALDPTLTQLTADDTADIATVNSMTLDGGSTGGTGGSTDGSGSTTDQPPVISGSPSPSVLQDTQYRFVPQASDPDNDPLVFSVANAPSWTGFDSATGTLSGTPGAGDVGTYTDIRISVSDGTLSTELAPFSIEVQATALGTATLSWTAPTQRTDGSPLNDLAGFKVYWGTAADTLVNVIPIDNPGVTTYVVENLPGGSTYYFATSAFDSSGIESALSNVASKSIP
jgi:hypothetical protein